MKSTSILQHFSHLTIPSSLWDFSWLWIKSMSALYTIHIFWVCFFFKPCPSATLLGLSSHLLLPHSICLLYPFLMLAPFALFPCFLLLFYFGFLSAISDHLCFLILSPFHPHSNTRTPHPHHPVSDTILLSSSFPSMSTFYTTPQFSTLHQGLEWHRSYIHISFINLFLFLCLHFYFLLNALFNWP